MKTKMKHCAAGLLMVLPLLTHAVPAAKPVKPGKTADAPRSEQAIDTTMELFAGEARVLPLNAARIAIGNGKIVSASSIAENQLLILADSAGSTTLHLWLKDGSEREIVVRVLEADMKRTLDDVNRLLGSVENVRARIAGTKIVLEGDMVSDVDQERAAAIVKMFPDQVVSFIGKVGWEKMVHLDVKVLELTTSGARNLGIRWDADNNGPSAGILYDYASKQLYRPLIDEESSGMAFPGGGVNLPAKVWPPKGFITLASSITSRINLLVQDGEAQMLAAPSLTTRSGSKARFIAGGELPLPTVNNFGGTKVEFKEYGIIVEVTPVTDKSGAIYAKVDVEVSSIDRSVAVLGIPGLLKRRASAEFNSRDGDAVVLNGLYAYEDANDKQKVPGLGNVPVIGGLFRNKSGESRERELAIVITPRLVQATPRPREPADVNGEKLYEFDKKLRERDIGPAPAARLSITE
jgi:pilus assembly protein CpaC